MNGHEEFHLHSRSQSRVKPEASKRRFVRPKNETKKMVQRAKHRLRNNIMQFVATITAIAAYCETAL